MKILQAHNYYQQGGGEDVVVAAERDLLVSHGHEVRQYTVSNNVVGGFWKKVVTGCRVHYSHKSRRNFYREIIDFRPDVVHVHNFFPLLTPSIYDACHEAGVPVVQTLHNFRPVCPAGFLLRNGLICKQCLNTVPYKAVIHRCYRNCFSGSLAVAFMIDYHHRQRTWHEKVDCFICLTEYSKSEFVQGGFPAHKMVVKPNFIDTGAPAPGTGRHDAALFVGRLSKEKGVSTLLSAWSGMSLPLLVVGEGPLSQTARACGLENVTFLGAQPRQEVMALMQRARFLVMPSEGFETFGLVIVEAFANGLPVVASRLGSIPEIVEDGVIGVLFEAGNREDLARKVRWACDHPAAMKEMGERARRVFDEKYSREKNYGLLMEIYRAVIAKSQPERPGSQSSSGMLEG